MRSPSAHPDTRAQARHRPDRRCGAWVGPPERCAREPVGRGCCEALGAVVRPSHRHGTGGTSEVEPTLGLGLGLGGETLGEGLLHHAGLLGLHGLLLRDTPETTHCRDTVRVGGRRGGEEPLRGERAWGECTRRSHPRGGHHGHAITTRTHRRRSTPADPKPRG